jgi:hypothetical protein
VARADDAPSRHRRPRRSGRLLPGLACEAGAALASGAALLVSRLVEDGRRPIRVPEVGAVFAVQELRGRRPAGHLQGNEADRVRTRHHTHHSVSTARFLRRVERCGFVMFGPPKRSVPPDRRGCGVPRAAACAAVGRRGGCPRPLQWRIARRFPAGDRVAYAPAASDRGVLSMLRTMAHRADVRPAVLFSASRDRESVAFQDDRDALAGRLSLPDRSRARAGSGGLRPARPATSPRTSCGGTCLPAATAVLHLRPLRR